MTESIETSGEIAREAEISRARLALTLDRLRDNLTPQHLADEVLGNARRGASVVLKSVGETALQHPVPALLIGTAGAMLFSAAAGLAPSSSGRPTAPRNGTKLSSTGKESRWAGLGERPVVTALLGVVIGRWLAAMVRPSVPSAIHEKLAAAE